MEVLIFFSFIALTKIKEYNALEDFWKFLNLHKFLLSSLIRLDG